MRSAAVVAATLVALASPRAVACQDVPQPSGKSAGIDGAPRFIWPLKGRVVTDICSDGSDGRFKGIDIAVAAGAVVKAAAAGAVAYAGDELKQFGNLVIIPHGGAWITAYA